MEKLKKEDIVLLKEIIKTPYSTLLQEIKEQDYQEKKSLIEMIDTFKELHKKYPTNKNKEIIINLIADLEEVNAKIDRINEWILSK